MPKAVLGLMGVQTEDMSGGRSGDENPCRALIVKSALEHAALRCQPDAYSDFVGRHDRRDEGTAANESGQPPPAQRPPGARSEARMQG